MLRRIRAAAQPRGRTRNPLQKARQPTDPNHKMSYSLLTFYLSRSVLVTPEQAESVPKRRPQSPRAHPALNTDLLPTLNAASCTRNPLQKARQQTDPNHKISYMLLSFYL